MGKLLIGLGLMPFLLWADTERVSGIEWSYSVSGGEATVGPGGYGTRAISAGTLGAIKIPTTLGGYPVTRIGSYAFSYCSGLTSVTIPTSVTSIGGWAFEGCRGLTSVMIPAKVTSVGSTAFLRCSNLMTISVDSSNKAYASVDGILYNKAKTELVCCPGGRSDSVTIPSSVRSIGSYAFSGRDGVRSVTLPSTVRSIGEWAFSDCSQLSAVMIPSSVTNVGGAVFSDCPELLEIGLEAGNPRYKVVDGVLYTKDMKCLVVGPGGKVSLSIPAGVTDIANDAFRCCRRLKSVTIPSGVKRIGDSAFCATALESVVVPASVEKIEEWAFALNYLTSLVLSKGVESIGEYAFYDSGLSSVTIPSSVTSIGAYAFHQGRALTAISVDSGNKAYSSSNGILYNKEKTELIQCPGGKTGTVSIPSSVTSIGIGAFKGCSGLTSVKIPSGVTDIGSSAFSGCTNMTAVTIPSSVTRIGYSAFSGCSGLTSVTIPDGVTSIGASAFEGCSGLTTVTIPAGMTSVGSSAFSGCSALRKVCVRGESEGDVNDVKRMFAESGFDGSGVTFYLFDMRYAVFALNVYDGLICDASSNFVGVVQVRTSRQNDNTGMVTATATVTDANGKTWSYAGGKVEILSFPSGVAADDAVGLVTGLKCSAAGCPVAQFDVVLDGDRLEGDWGGNAIVGTRNGKGDDDDPTAEVLARCKGKWSVTVGGDGAALAPVGEVLRIQLNIQAKGVVRVLGNWECGEKVNKTAQMVVLNDVAHVPVILGATKTTPALTALIKFEDGELTLVSASDPTRPEAEPYRFVAGGRTTEMISISGYLAEDFVAPGVDYAGRVAINELAYPAKFTQKGLPKGLKLNVATGVVSGKPSKPGVYDVTFTAKSAENSRSNDICRATIHVSNYADPNIAVADSYGPYTPGVLCGVEIREAVGCTVSGLPAGLKWAAKEVRAKDGTLIAVANSVYGIPTKPGNYTVYFKKKIEETNDKGKVVKVEHISTSTFVVADYPTIAIWPVLASDGVGADIPVAGGTNLVFMAGVAQSVSLNLEGTLDGVATTVKAKGLPSGLKLVKTAVYVDPNAKKKVVDHYVYAIEGAPTAVSKINGRTKAVTPSHVTLSASNKYKWSGVFAFDVTVIALPNWAVGNFSGTVAAPDGSHHGIATLTVGKTGKISGKIATQGTNWTYRAKSYAGWSAVSATNFIVEAVAKSGKIERLIELTVADLGRAERNLGVFEARMAGTFGRDEVDQRRIVWKDPGGKALAYEYAGAYTYIDVTGVHYSIVIAKSATAKLIGQVNGRKATLSTTILTDLAEDGEMAVVAAFYKAPAKSGKTSTPEFYRFVEIQNWHSEPVAGGVATRDSDAVLLVNEEK